MDWEFFWPTTTFLKSTTEGMTEIFAAASSLDEFSAETEAQPEERPEIKIVTAKRVN